MDKPMQFDYYYGIEAEQFSFYRVPRLLIKDERFKGLSSDAKLLYGLMLDRMALSMKNGWFDAENRAYIIYTIENIREDFGCSKEKAVKILAELDAAKGIGLIEKVRRGLGKPDIIYVKNFVLSETKEPVQADSSAEVGNSDFRRSEKQTSESRENGLQEVRKTDFKESEKQTCAGRKNRLQEVGKSNPNYTDNNYTDLNQTEKNHINHIRETERITRNDMTDDAAAYVELIKKNIEYEHHMRYDNPADRELYGELFEIICEVVCIRHQSVRINGEDYPYELVKSRFLKLNSSHLEYVIGCMKDTVTKIKNVRSYMVTALYNAPSTMQHYFQQEVNHDMFGGGWDEKGIV